MLLPQSLAHSQFLARLVGYRTSLIALADLNQQMGKSAEAERLRALAQAVEDTLDEDEKDAAVHVHAHTGDATSSVSVSAEGDQVLSAPAPELLPRCNSAASSSLFSPLSTSEKFGRGRRRLGVILIYFLSSSCTHCRHNCCVGWTM
jgi:hypothetical protein